MTTTSYTQPPRADRPEWIRTKSIGDAGEIRAAAVFKALGLIVNRHVGMAATDLTISGTIECKADNRAMTTNNAAIEVSYRGQPSGITTSTASGWAIVTGDVVHLTPTASLRALVERGNYPRVAAGENAVVALVPLPDLRRISRVAHLGGATR